MGEASGKDTPSKLETSTDGDEPRSFGDLVSDDDDFYKVRRAGASCIWGASPDGSRMLETEAWLNGPSLRPAPETTIDTITERFAAMVPSVNVNEERVEFAGNAK